MPTGTGKTVCLLAVTTAYQYAAAVRATAAGAGTRPAVGKIIYCTRTVQEMDKAMEELKRVHKYRDEELTKAGVVVPPVRSVARVCACGAAASEEGMSECAHRGGSQQRDSHATFTCMPCVFFGAHSVIYITCACSLARSVPRRQSQQSPQYVRSRRSLAI